MSALLFPRFIKKAGKWSISKLVVRLRLNYVGVFTVSVTNAIRKPRNACRMHGETMPVRRIHIPRKGKSNEKHPAEHSGNTGQSVSASIEKQLEPIFEPLFSDGRILKLVRQMLKPGYMESGKKHATPSGTPQGNVVSPLFSNVYLNRFDHEMTGRGYRLTIGSSSARHRRKPRARFGMIERFWSLLD